MTLATDILARDAAGKTLCAHCNLPVPTGLIDPSAEDQFCCAGCRAVFDTLQACGLEAYYLLRGEHDSAPRAVELSTGSFASFDSQTFDELYVEHRPDGICCVDLALEGITCAACVWLVERLPRVIDGVIEARLCLREAIVRITWDPVQVKLPAIAGALARIGYKPHPARGESGREIHRRESRRRLIHLGVAGAIMGNTMLLGLALYAGNFGNMEGEYRTFFRWISAGLGLISLAWPGATFFRSAWSALRLRTTNLDVPIALALATGGVAGMVNVVLNRGEIYFDSLTVLVFLLLVGRFIQYRQQRRADDAVGLLFSLTPSSCRVIREGQVIDTPVEALIRGDLIEVRPGELFPADGTVQSGRSTVNEALLTGESMPAPVEVGGDIHAGSQNVGSVLRVCVEKTGRETRVGKLMQLIERGVGEKPAVVQFADRVGGIFAIVVTLFATAVFAFWCRRSLSAAIDHSVALLIVTCPCVLGLATPLTLAMTIGRLARRDILVKSGAALERLARGGRLLLDKTGTLTEGRLRLIEWAGDTQWQPLIGEIEKNSNHPVGRALYEAFGARELDASSRLLICDVLERGDGGISANFNDTSVQIGSRSFLARKGIALPLALCNTASEMEQNGLTTVAFAIGGKAIAVAGLGDRIREDSGTAVAALHEMGWRPQILSGDAPDVAWKVARQVGIRQPDALGGLSPEQKLSIVGNREPGRVTVMVGDGVNDAAALAAADIGIAVHGGAEASLAAADVYIARPGLESLVELVNASRRTMRIVHRNLVISLGYNLLAGALAAAGMMTPLLAAIIMPISSATVLSLTVMAVAGRRHGKAK